MLAPLHQRDANFPNVVTVEELNGARQITKPNTKHKYIGTSTRGSLYQTNTEPSASFTESDRHPPTIIIIKKQNRFSVSIKRFFCQFNADSLLLIYVYDIGLLWPFYLQFVVFCVVFTGCTRILQVRSYYSPRASAKPKLRDFAPHPPTPKEVEDCWCSTEHDIYVHSRWIMPFFSINMIHFRTQTETNNMSGGTIWRSRSSAAGDSGPVGSLACQTSCTTNNSWSKNYNVNNVKSCKTMPHKNLGGGVQDNGNVVWELHVMTSTAEKAKTLT